MDELLEIANSYNVPIIEDAAESLGAEYKGKKSGTLGKIGIYSFNGNKIITTSGGGVLISDDEEIIARSRFLATQARDEAPHYQHSVVGYNYRMSNILAGVGIAQLQVLDERVTRRREIFDTYYQELAGIEGVQFMPELSGTKSNRWLTTLTIDQKIIQLSPYEIMDKMNEANIETRALWKPLHMQPLFKDNKFYKDKNSLESTAGLLFANGLCLPSGSNMSDSDQARVLQKFKKIVLGE